MLGHLPEPRRAEYLAFLDAGGLPIDRGIALYFPAPHSFTGEHVLELQGHGGPVVLDMLLERALELGARPARPGEFSERAFLNDRLDLAQAEAIADLIDSGSREAARSAMRSLSGEFSERVHALVESVIALRVHVEAAIDFPDEDIDFLADDAIAAQFRAIARALEDLTAAAYQGALLREGIAVVIAGRPNAGKSSLLNRLARRDVAIVSDIAGTTRDILRENIALDGLPLRIVDTAGLRDSVDPLERIGVERARGEIARADRILLVVDDAAGTDDQAPEEVLPEAIPPASVTVVHNKCDLTQRPPSVSEDDAGRTHIRLSARTGEGLDLLVAHLKACVRYAGPAQGTFMARRRHIDALKAAAGFVQSGWRQIEEARAGDLAAEDLRQAQRVLGEITGEFTSEDLLGRLFASFCIGK